MINEETPFLRFDGFATVFIKLTKLKLKLNWERERFMVHCPIYITTRKLSNPNRNINKKNSSINHNDFYWRNISLLFLLVYTDINFLSVNTEENTVGNEGIKKIKFHFYKKIPRKYTLY
jgi:hypothetical protein